MKTNQLSCSADAMEVSVMSFSVAVRDELSLASYSEAQEISGVLATAGHWHVSPSRLHGWAKRFTPVEAKAGGSSSVLIVWRSWGRHSCAPSNFRAPAWKQTVILTRNTGLSSLELNNVQTVSTQVKTPLKHNKLLQRVSSIHFHRRHRSPFKWTIYW